MIVTLWDKGFAIRGLDGLIHWRTLCGRSRNDVESLIKRALDKRFTHIKWFTLCARSGDASPHVETVEGIPVEGLNAKDVTCIRCMAARQEVTE